MASHFISINRGKEGMKASDFTNGTSTTAGDTFEFRVLDGASATKKDVHNALKAIGRWFENAQQVSATGFDVNG